MGTGWGRHGSEGAGEKKYSLTTQKGGDMEELWV